MSEMIQKVVEAAVVAEAVQPELDDKAIIEKLPKVETVKRRVEELTAIRDRKIENLDKELENEIDNIRTVHKQMQDAAIKAIRNRVKTDKAVARNSCKIAISKWNTVLKSLEADVVNVEDLEEVPGPELAPPPPAPPAPAAAAESATPIPPPA